jgi:MYXO-CTERM domain-containing protein
MKSAFRPTRLVSRLLAAGALFAAVSAGATSVSFTALGQQQTFQWAAANVDGANLAATVSFTLSAWSTNTATFSVLMNNSTLVANPGTNRMVSFGISVVTPDLIGVTDNSPTWNTGINANIPGGFGKVDFCAWGGVSCTGGSNGGISEGQSTSFNVTMSFAQAVQNQTITFTSPFAAKWQSVGNTGSSWTLAGCVMGVNCNVPPPPPVKDLPVPGSLALAALALAGVGVARRRRAA